ncbi:endoribonuclease L-PSP [Kwoniella mangroviensis CBS 10435]|uniref:Endoribonuclease L-PSP n=1 Tax=Kwoniella mangroviensis CBS 10435 TaxID=1331196 RepID=A0A1B9IHX8_9TREE|nr:endoribonuclease L-PSP [Kwoniella mangroviensis CBS 8507]OCF55047.1 endoribonuclease L-PSP [Kwoniella mangroviensis CBS 10435]OCF62477.1 endoribonuclease L-PSP [Kwoniella mangroviensis CBS 8507]OCF72231.1 endoribonuclease L-PSP [Kwoniella mangroviensis CBS 8886]
MSHLPYFAYPGSGHIKQRDFHYSQAVRIGDFIHCSGQGGWNPETDVIYKEINAQIDQAFINVDIALKDAGGKGWEQVYQIDSYHVPINNEALEAMVRNMRKWCPNHKPLFTCVGVPRLGEDDMRVEIKVSAHDPEGAAKAAREAK